jgi:alkylation response protein AidB-like acyl-CoA dehydrogenase
MRPLSEEERLFRDLVRRFAGERLAANIRRAGPAFDRSAIDAEWMQLVALGCTAIGIPGNFGGLGPAGPELLIAMEGIGRGLVAAPLQTSVIQAASLLAALADDRQKRRLLPGIADGSLKMAPALLEPGGAPSSDMVPSTHAKRVDGGLRLTGQKSMVFGAESADALLVAAAVAGGSEGQWKLVAILPDAPGVTLQPWLQVDGRQVTTVDLDGVFVDAENSFDSGDVIEAVRASIDLVTVAICAECVGSMDALLETTLDYVKTRRQFGSALADFQVIQHRLTEIAVHCAEARAVTAFAFSQVNVAPLLRQRAVAITKAKVAAGSRYVAQQAVQLHGGMGMTLGLPVGHLFQRLLANEILYGDDEHHRSRVQQYAGDASWPAWDII